MRFCTKPFKFSRRKISSVNKKQNFVGFISNPKHFVQNLKRFRSSAEPFFAVTPKHVAQRAKSIPVTIPASIKGLG
jgi:hypothetical protein